MSEEKKEIKPENKEAVNPAEAPKTEAPKAEAPKQETPKTEAPKAEAAPPVPPPQKAEEPKTEAAKPAEAKKAEEKKVGKPEKCAVCNKSIKKKRYYYRNGKYYCTKRCWTKTVKKENKEAGEKPAAPEAKQ